MFFAWHFLGFGFIATRGVAYTASGFTSTTGEAHLASGFDNEDKQDQLWIYLKSLHKLRYLTGTS